MIRRPRDHPTRWLRCQTRGCTIPSLAGFVCECSYSTRVVAGLANLTTRELQMRCIDDYQRLSFGQVPE